MVFDLNNDYKRERFEEWTRKVMEKRVIVKASVQTPKRSTAQNKYLHLILGAFALNFGYSVEEVKQLIFKRLCNRDVFRTQVQTKWDAEPVEHWRSTSELSTAEMTTAITRFRNWSSAVAHYYLPSPNEGEHLLYIEGDLEENKEYIEQPEN